MKHLGRNYFLRAMEVFQQQLPHPVFVLVTDDTDWAAQQIPRGFRPYFTGFHDPASQASNSKLKIHVIYVSIDMSWLQDSAGLDLAVLSLCSHSILSRGTFGLWGNILSGGPRILPKHFSGEARGDPLQIHNQVQLKLLVWTGPAG